MTRIAVAARSFNRTPTLRAELLARYPAVTFSELASVLEGDAQIVTLHVPLVEGFGESQ